MSTPISQSVPASTGVTAAVSGVAAARSVGNGPPVAVRSRPLRSETVTLVTRPHPGPSGRLQVVQEIGRHEVQLVRETLEGILSPGVSSRIMFEALQHFGRVPSTSDDVRAMVHASLPPVLRDRVGAADRDAILSRLTQILEGCGDGSGNRDDASDFLDIDVDLADEETGATLAAPISVAEPVPVVIASASEHLAYCFEAALGAARIGVTTAGDEAGLRHAAFARSPLLVVIDAVEAPGVRAAVLANAIRGLPEATVVVVWGADGGYGVELASALGDGESRVVLLERAEGVEPILDLVSSRHQTA